MLQGSDTRQYTGAVESSTREPYECTRARTRMTEQNLRKLHIPLNPAVPTEFETPSCARGGENPSASVASQRVRVCTVRGAATVGA